MGINWLQGHFTKHVAKHWWGGEKLILAPNQITPHFLHLCSENVDFFETGKEIKHDKSKSKWTKLVPEIEI